MTRVLGHRTLYRHPRFHAAFPSMLRFGDGNLLLAFRRARDGQWLLNDEQRRHANPLGSMDHIDARSHVALQELDPTGKQPVGDLDMLPMDPEAGDQDPSLLLLPGDDLLLASFSWYPLPAHIARLIASCGAPGEGATGYRYLFWGSHSSRRGRQAGDWRFDHSYLEPAGGFGRVQSPDGSKRVVGAVRGQLLYAGGELLLAAYGGAKEGCALFASRDGGRNWLFRGLIARSDAIAFQEPALCHDGHGGIRCFMRTAGAGGRLATSHCSDGVNWSSPTLHQLVGHPFHPLVLSDGRVLLSYGYRHEPYGIRARLLENPRQDPDRAMEIIIRDDGCCPDLGYPWAVELQGGEVMVSYYWTDVHGSRLIAASWLELD